MWLRLGANRMTTDKIEQAKEFLEKKGYLIKEPKKKKTVIIGNVEYELEQHDNGKKLSEIKIPNGYRLLLPSEAMMLYEKGLIGDSFWFFVEQTNKDEKKKGNVARFDAGSDWAGLSCYWVPSGADSGLGVIFAHNLTNKGDKK